MNESLKKNQDGQISFKNENSISNNKVISLRQIASILLILAGILAIFTWLSIATLDPSIVETLIDNQYDPITLTAESLKDTFVVCGAIGFLFGVFMILAGIMILRRQLWGMGIAASVIGLFTIGPIFLSSIMSFLALIFLVYSKNEF
jgi:hypothetical protein